MNRSDRAKPSPSTAASVRTAQVSGQTIAERIRGILRARNLSLYKVSTLTRSLYAHDPRCRIPRNLYFQLRSEVWTPTVPQLFALSRASGYQLADWLAVVGVPLSAIPRLQAELSHPRTILLDSTDYGPREPIPWFRDRFPGHRIPDVAPLSQLLEPSGTRRLTPPASGEPNPYLYAKVGCQDAFAFPDLLPGSIVRANAQLLERLTPVPKGELSKHIFLVGHSRGICCCRLYFETLNRVTLAATQLPFANVELQLESEAKILGVVDMELRSLPGHRRTLSSSRFQPEIAPELARLWAPRPLLQSAGVEHPTRFVRAARQCAGLSLRRASEMSRSIANALHDERYFASLGWLSDFEASAVPPRHIHKLLTVSVLYSIRIAELLTLFGLSFGETRAMAIPDEWMRSQNRPPPQMKEATATERASTDFLARILGRLGEVPFFLRQSLAHSSGLPEITLRDVFWVGGQRPALHPSLAGAMFVVADRSRRRPRMFRRKSPWEQPVYLVMRRNESYVLASCNLENGTIVVHPYGEGFARSERLRDGIDAQVVGQVVAVIRSLLSPP